jgi:hypothetical protein
MMLECQVRSGAQWEAVDIKEARKSYVGKDKRCIECHGPVCAHKTYTNGTPAHFEHLRAHPGCSQILSSYVHPKSKHPDALK